jgi:hypothetical protein
MNHEELSNSLSFALKEWAVVCRALETGRQMILLRKGGIYESAGEFELEHREFLLFPSYLHQNEAMLKSEVHDQLANSGREPSELTLSAAGVVTDILQLKSRQQMDALEDEHIWRGALIDMRFNYRPENPLYLLLVRTHRLAQPVTIQNTPAYAGCKSWVPLEKAIDTRGARPVLDEKDYGERRDRILAHV